MRSKKTIAAQLMEHLKAAYADLDVKPYAEDPDRAAQALGRYEGLKQAYVLLTRRPVNEVAHEVVGWYIRTPEYQAAKDAES